MIELVAFEPRLRDALFAFLSRCLPESGRSFDPAGRHAHLEHIEDGFDAFWCLVEDGEDVVGCVGLRELEPGASELKTLFLYERLQGQGWGRRLAERAIARARLRGDVAVRLDTTSASRGAIALYRRLGFRDIDRYNDNPAADVFMQLGLS